MSSNYLIRGFFLVLGCISLSFTSCKKEVKTIKHSEVIFKKEGDEVYTVSKFLILVLAPVKIDKTN